MVHNKEVNVYGEYQALCFVNLPISVATFVAFLAHSIRLGTVRTNLRLLTGLAIMSLVNIAGVVYFILTVWL